MAIEDVIGAADALELQDAEEAVLTERFLLEEEWPGFMTCPVRRWMETRFETGQVRRDHYGHVEAVVYVPDSHIGVRRYGSVPQMVAAGWRVD